MSREHHDDDCPGCQPTLIDTSTGRPLPRDDARMQIMLATWKTQTTPEERAAFHRVCISNGRVPGDLAIVERLSALIKKAMHS